MPSIGADQELERFREKQKAWKDIYVYPLTIFHNINDIPVYNGEWGNGVITLLKAKDETKGE